MKYGITINTKIGVLSLIEEDNKIMAIEIGKKMEQEEFVVKETPLLQETQKQVIEYLEGNRKNFTIPFSLKGTKFMKAVWTALQEIPYGEVRNYGQIAKKVGNPKAARAVGMANHRNPLPILIPCHRVIGTSGKLVGYACGLEIKQFLLELEQKNKTRKRG